MELLDFVGKNVEITIHRRKYNTKNHDKIFTGRLTDLSNNMVCLKTKSGKSKWVPRPSMYKDSVREIGEI